MECAHNFRITQKRIQVKATQKPTDGTIWIAKTYPPWQSCVLDTMREFYEVSSFSFLPDGRLKFLSFRKTTPRFQTTRRSRLRWARKKFSRST